MIRPHLFVLFLALMFQVSLAPLCLAGETKILSAVGRVSLQRHGDTPQPSSIPAGARTELESGDFVSTAGDGGASLLVGPCLVYLGSNTTVQVTWGQTPPTIHVNRGQARAVVTGRPGVRIVTATAEATAGEGILRVAVDRSGARIISERGSTQVQHKGLATEGEIALASYAQIETTTLQEGQQVVVPSQGGAAPPAPVIIDNPEDDRARIDVQTLQNQAAASAQQQMPPATTRGTAPASRNVVTAQNNIATAPGLGFGFGAFFSASSFGASGGANADNFQRTDNGMLLSSATIKGEPDLGSGDMFNGSIQLVTAQNQTDNELLESGALAESQYWSIASTIGNPTLQDFDILVQSKDANFTTVIAAQETVALGPGQVAVRYANVNLEDLDPIQEDFTSFGPDNGSNGTLIGDTPEDTIKLRSEGNATDAASIVNDGLASLNSKLSYALGRIFLSEDGGMLRIGLRGSDQDRKIEYSDPNDRTSPADVTANPLVTFRRATQDDVDADDATGNGETELNDLIPDTYNRSISLSELGPNSKSALTKIMASSLRDFAGRTGQTRFVVDGQIIDIKGAPTGP